MLRSTAACSLTIQASAFILTSFVKAKRHGHVKRVAFMLAARSVVRRYLRLRVNVHLDRAEVFNNVTPFLFVGNKRSAPSLDHNLRPKTSV